MVCLLGFRVGGGAGRFAEGNVWRSDLDSVPPFMQRSGLQRGVVGIGSAAM